MYYFWNDPFKSWRLIIQYVNIIPVKFMIHFCKRYDEIIEGVALFLLILLMCSLLNVFSSNRIRRLTILVILYTKSYRNGHSILSLPVFINLLSIRNGKCNRKTKFFLDGFEKIRNMFNIRYSEKFFIIWCLWRRIINCKSKWNNFFNLFGY